MEIRVPGDDAVARGGWSSICWEKIIGRKNTRDKYEEDLSHGMVMGIQWTRHGILLGFCCWILIFNGCGGWLMSLKFP